MTLLYEGKAKQVYNTDCPEEVIIHFKDDATAFNGIKKDTIPGKGRVNLAFTRFFFQLLQENGIKTHIISFLDELSLRARKVEIFPVELVIRNYAAGSICKRLGFEKRFKFDPPLCEFFLKNDALGDPLLCREHILQMGLMNDSEIEQVKDTAMKINYALSSYLDAKGVILADFKIEFGKDINGEILLADEISPDTCRFWLKDTMESLDKDVYREDRGDLISSYNQLADILGVR